MLPPLAPDVDFAALGERFKLSGGNIKNAVVRAAYMAASTGALALDHATLVGAARLEWSELGNLPEPVPAPVASPVPLRPVIASRGFAAARSTAGGGAELIDVCLLDVLARQPGYGETIELCFHRKEHELGALLAELSVADARAMHRRLSRDPAPGDELAVQFGRLKIERRRRLLEFLADARRRAATTRRAS
jgi:hypothetical protein